MLSIVQILINQINSTVINTKCDLANGSLVLAWLCNTLVGTQYMLPSNYHIKD